MNRYLVKIARFYEDSGGGFYARPDRGPVFRRRAPASGPVSMETLKALNYSTRGPVVINNLTVDKPKGFADKS